MPRKKSPVKKSAKRGPNRRVPKCGAKCAPKHRRVHPNATSNSEPLVRKHQAALKRLPIGRTDQPLDGLVPKHAGRLNPHSPDTARAGGRR